MHRRYFAEAADVGLNFYRGPDGPALRLETRHEQDEGCTHDQIDAVVIAEATLRSFLNQQTNVLRSDSSHQHPDLGSETTRELSLSRLAAAVLT